MKRAATVILISIFAIRPALAANWCEINAVSRDGKVLSGAAKASAMRKCCEETATVDGKALSGAARASYVKKCERG